MNKLIIFLLAWFFQCIQAKPEADKVASLNQMKGFPDTFDKYDVYSGHFFISNYWDIHYVLVEAESGWENAPLVLWLEGGPGCSAMIGLFQVNGPYLLPNNGTTYQENPYSWNKEANVLYIETPPGVGFSGCSNQSHTQTCHYDDNSTAALNLHVMNAFFVIFPEYRNHSLYIAGESYGGVFAPLLAYEMYNFNLK